MGVQERKLRQKRLLRQEILDAASRRPYRYANQLPFQVENFILTVKHASEEAPLSRALLSVGRVRLANF